MDDKNQTNQDSVNETTLFENEAKEDSVNETTPSENDKSNNQKLSRFKKILLVGLGIVLIGIVVSIFAMTVGIVIGVIGALIAFVGYKLQEPYCPQCGARHRRIRYHVSTNLNRTYSYSLNSKQEHGPGTAVKKEFNHVYHHIRDCEKCGYHREWDEKQFFSETRYPDGNVHVTPMGGQTVKPNYDRT